MEIEFHDPFDICRTNLRLALRFGSLAQEWRQHVCTLQVRRIERDKEALESEREALARARDWGEFNTATQTVMREYFAATVSLWQEGVGVAMRNQTVVGEAFADILKDWQSAWTGGYAKPASGASAAIPDWVNGFTLAMRAAQQAAGAPTAPAQGAKGDHHAV
ncbi:hypothetical protein AWB67_07421 [Caballeronia terrestris]|jgi:hypothetical protein|uniref:Phasin family protein n=4 Tax=Burkholderiaceae TaxID=119060 RepID=A0A158KSK9_9BURK|nr:hypothetical protein [Caballeronia choica]SAL61786.1 hypothetical protein AWB65_05648 [Caballeronia humi]SAL84097.1 hypothetical protein AWB68_07165 [Caballeronia choica]SAL87485.1 hypothetical protein AWB67_07421 [Caballeronia terrestris]